jgi:adenylate cyclase
MESFMAAMRPQLQRCGHCGGTYYGAIGTVTNLAARLCGEARPGQVLVSRRVFATVENRIEVEPIGGLSLKGFLKPATTFNVLRFKDTPH